MLDPTDGTTMDISPGCHGQQRPGHERRHTATASTRSPASRTRRTWCRRATTPRARRVLGGRAQVGDAARPLERDRQRGRRRARLRAPHRRHGSGRSTGSSGTSRRTSRSTARSTTPPSRPGAQGLLRLGAADLDDPLHGRQGPVERRKNLPSYDPEGLPLVPGPRGGHHARAARARAAPRRRSRKHVGQIAIKAWRGNPADPRPRRRRRRGSWARVAALPEAHLRDAGVPGLHLRPQHVQPRRRRGADRADRQRVLPWRPG